MSRLLGLIKLIKQVYFIDHINPPVSRQDAQDWENYITQTPKFRQLVFDTIKEQLGTICNQVEMMNKMIKIYQ